MIFQSNLISQQNFKELMVQEHLHHLSKMDCTSPVQGEINPVEPNNNQRYSQRVSVITKKNFRDPWLL
jgi:hypothetical protein